MNITQKVKIEEKVKNNEEFAFMATILKIMKNVKSKKSVEKLIKKLNIYENMKCKKLLELVRKPSENDEEYKKVSNIDERGHNTQESR